MKRNPRKIEHLQHCGHCRCDHRFNKRRCDYNRENLKLPLCRFTRRFDLIVLIEVIVEHPPVPFDCVSVTFSFVDKQLTSPSREEERGAAPFCPKLGIIRIKGGHTGGKSSYERSYYKTSVPDNLHIL